MNRAAALTAISPGLRRPGIIAALGGLFIAAIVALAGYDIVREYHRTVEATSRELDIQARTIAEQTAQSIRAVDILLRHLSQQFRLGAFGRMDGFELHGYLAEQAVGLAQIDGLSIRDEQGTAVAMSWVYPTPHAGLNVSDRSYFQTLRDRSELGLYVGGAIQSRIGNEWVFPIVRRLENTMGEFAGIVSARGRIDYFQDFYRGIQLDPGTKVVLMHHDATMIARFPPTPEALGKHFALFARTLAAHKPGQRSWTRTVSPVDGIERFGAMRPVPDFPLAVVVTRDVSVALAPWQRHAWTSTLRTLVLAAFAGLLLAIAIRQLTRLNAARASLAASDERYALAVAGSDVGIWDWDYAAGLCFASARARAILGVSSEPQTQSIESWHEEMAAQLHPDDNARRQAAADAHLTGKTPFYECDYRVKDGSGGYRWVRSRGLCVRRGGDQPHRMAGSITDIDARKRAENALRESEERFALAVAGSNDGIVDWDVPNDRMYSSERAMQILGIDGDVTVRSRNEWRDLVVYHPDDHARMKKDLENFLAGRTELREGEYRVRLPDGRYRWIRHRNKCVRDAAGRPIRVAGSVSDIDAQKRVEGQLLQAKKLEAIGTLAGGIAHDFNNILAAILGYGEMAQKDAQAGTALRRHIDATVGAGLRAKALVERILAFSRSGIGERKPVDVQAIAAEALEHLGGTLPPQIRLVRHLNAQGAAVMGDPTQIHQVIMNLCTNAVQAMKTGGSLAVTLDLETKDDLVMATSAVKQGRYVRLTVADTGTGIPADVLERVFDPFYTTKGAGVGTGLGLSLVHGIVTDLGGGIEVASTPEVGTTFTVYLPMTDSAALSHTPREAPPLGDGETVLLVDDEEPLVRLGEEVLAGLGYEPVGFTSSAAALQAFRAEPERFAMVLSDEAMPGMTGLEIACEMQRVRRDVPIVLMTGFVNAATIERARALGIVAVLDKPVVADDLARALADALRTSV